MLDRRTNNRDGMLRLWTGQIRIKPIELPYLAVGAPAEITIPRLAQMGVGGCLEAARMVEPGGRLMGNGFVLNETVVAGRANGLLVKAHGIEVAAFDPGDFRAHQCSAIFEIFGAVLRPDCKLPVVIGQRLEVLLSRALGRRFKSRSASESAVKVILRHFKEGVRCPEQAFSVQRCLDCGGAIPGKETRL